MKKNVSVIAGSFLLAAALMAVIGCTSMGGAQIKADEAALVAMGDKYVENVNSGDVDKYMTAWAENGIQMPPDAPAVFGKDNIKLAMIPVFDNFYTKMSINTEETKVAGDWGYARGTYLFDLTPKAGGDPVHVDGKFLTIYERQPDGSWLITRDCFNSNVPAG
jgi:uncharacterized protein (TIGR02246 family)